MPHAPIKLALLRHGHTSWNREHRIQGRSDIPLDDQARADLASFSLPDPWDRAALWSSPLARARETADLVAGRVSATTPGLTEMNWGHWEGQHGATLRSDPSSGFRDIEDWGWEYHPPAGETPAEVWARLEPWLASLTTNTVAICHIGVMRVILARAYGWNFDGPAPFSIKRNRLFVVEIAGRDLIPWPEPVRLLKKDTP
jgi:probable phosphoglycerate mutase